jgi:uncharacterized protein with GYD domain
MSNYIILFNFTDLGIRNVKETIERAQSYKAAIEKAGGKFLTNTQHLEDMILQQ